MPRIEVSIPEDQMQKIKDGIRTEVERNFDYEKLMEYLKKQNDVSFTEYLWKYGIMDRVEKLKDVKVGDLSENQKLMLCVYWIISQDFRRY